MKPGIFLLVFVVVIVAIGVTLFAFYPHPSPWEVALFTDLAILGGVLSLGGIIREVIKRWRRSRSLEYKRK